MTHSLRGSLAAGVHRLEVRDALQLGHEGDLHRAATARATRAAARFASALALLRTRRERHGGRDAEYSDYLQRADNAHADSFVVCRFGEAT